MKILWIAHRDLQHDLNVATWLEMTSSLANRNHEVTLIAMKTSGKKFSKRLPNAKIKELNVINYFPLVSISFHLQIMILTIYWLFAIRPDVVLSHPITAIFILPAILIAKIVRMKIKFVLDIRTLPVRLINLNDKIKDTLINISIYIGKLFFDGITTITPALQKFLADGFHIYQQKIGIWMSGVNINLFYPRTKTIDSSPKFIVMYHGILAANRGIIETIHAMVEVNKQFPRIMLLIVGKGLSIKKMMALVNHLNLDGTVQFHDAVDYYDIPELICKADVGIIPLPDELCWRVSSPLKMIEYLAMAKPVIVSPIEAHTSVLKDCPAAIFLKSTTPAGISEGIIKAYCIKEQLAEMGKAGRTFVINNFTWDYQALRLEKFLAELN